MAAAAAAVATVAATTMAAAAATAIAAAAAATAAAAVRSCFQRLVHTFSVAYLASGPFAWRDRDRAARSIRRVWRLILVECLRTGYDRDDRGGGGYGGGEYNSVINNLRTLRLSCHVPACSD